MMLQVGVLIQCQLSFPKKIFDPYRTVISILITVGLFTDNTGTIIKQLMWNKWHFHKDTFYKSELVLEAVSVVQREELNWLEIY